MSYLGRPIVLWIRAPHSEDKDPNVGNSSQDAICRLWPRAYGGQSSRTNAYTLCAVPDYAMLGCRTVYLKHLNTFLHKASCLQEVALLPVAMSNQITDAGRRQPCIGLCSLSDSSFMTYARALSGLLRFWATVSECGRPTLYTKIKPPNPPETPNPKSQDELEHCK